MVYEMKESAVTSHIRLKAAQDGNYLWRNNSGAFYDERGRFVRYGLGSFTPADNCASSDFIGIRPTLITPDMVGKIIGQFLAVEMKPTNWKFNKNDRHLLSQQNFIDIVRKAGGLAGFATSLEDYERIINEQ